MQRFFLCACLIALVAGQGGPGGGGPGGQGGGNKPPGPGERQPKAPVMKGGKDEKKVVLAANGFNVEANGTFLPSASLSPDLRRSFRAENHPIHP